AKTDYSEPTLYSSANDPSELGLLNEFLVRVKSDMEKLAPGDKTLWLKEPLPYKVSYVGVGDIHVRFVEVEKELAKRDNQGWAISLIEHKGKLKFPYIRPPYAYLRVHMDSSVKQYKSSYRMTADGNAMIMGDLFGEIKDGEE
ncbi:MAG: hypothetical protein KF812_11710, partial [Fimbriimonadaceae bacterium]|nr:hypothetical protein [Fimbriimonadaceae bacterium]